MAERNNNQFHDEIRESIDFFIKDSEPAIKSVIKLLQENNQYEELEQFLSSYRKLKSYMDKLPDTREEAIENIRNLREIFNKVSAIEANQVRLEEEVKQNKKETDEKIEKYQVSTNLKINQIVEQQKIYGQLIAANYNQINNVDAKLLTVFKLVVFTVIELNKLKEIVSNAAKTAAENFDIKNVAPEPSSKFELEYMEFLVEYKGWGVTGEGKEMKKFCNDLKGSLKATQKRCMNAAIQATISTAVKAVKNLSDDSNVEPDLSEDDKQSVTKTFVEGFTKDLFKIKSTNGWKEIVVKIALNLAVIGVVYTRTSLKLRKINKERLEAIKDRLDKFMGTLHEYMINPTKEEFDKMQKHYIRSMIKFNNKDGVNIKKESDEKYSNTVKKFSEIPEYEMSYPYASGEGNMLNNVLDVELFDWRNYLMRGLEDDAIEYFKYMCTVDRAINRKETSEFRNFNWCGSGLQDGKFAALCVVTTPLLGAGLLLGVIAAEGRLQEERIWSKNISNLLEIMRHCIIDFQTNELNRMIEIRKHIFLVENYYKATKSKYGKYHYETEYGEYKYLYVIPRDEEKKRFDTCIDLYFQYTNQERYDIKNYTEYSYQIVKQEAPQLSRTGQIFKEVVKGIATSVEFETKNDQVSVDRTRELPPLPDGTKPKITIKTTTPNRYLGIVKDVDGLFAELVR